MATLTYPEIVARLNAGGVVFLDCGGQPILIDNVGDIPGDLSNCGFLERNLSEYIIVGNPTNGQIPSYNSTTQKLQWSNAASGGGTWGSITGTLSNQTDLQTALNAKAPLANPSFTGSAKVDGTVFLNASSGSIQWGDNSALGTIRGFLGTTADGIFRFGDSAGGGSPQIILGSAGASTGIRLKRSATTLAIRNGDDTADASISASALTLSGSTSGYALYSNSGVISQAPIAVNALNSTYLSATSGASGAGVTLAVAGGGTNENLILTPKGTGQIYIPIGAVGTPMISNSTSPSTGIYFTSATAVSVAIGGVEKLRVNTGGQTGVTELWIGATVVGADVGISRHAAAILRVNNTSTGAGQLLVGTSSDTVSAQLDVRSQSTTRPAGRFQAASTTLGTQEMVGIYDGAGGSTFSITAGGATLARGTLDYNNPQYSFVGDTNTGLAWHSADILSLVAGGSETLRITTTTVDSLSSTIGGSNGGKLGLGSGGTFDTFLERDTANTLAQRNGTNGQTFRVYGTYTDASNYERLEIVTRANTTLIQQAQAGTGVARALAFGTTGSTNLILYTGNTDRWVINSSGHFLANVDNTYDIGASGANRPRNYYGAGDVSIGNGANFYWQSRSVISSPADGTIRFTNAATTGFDRLQFGGTSASFPALKRSGTALQVKLADDSAFASIRLDSFQVVNSSNQVKMEASNPSTGYYNTSDISFNWSGSTTSNATPDLTILRDAANILAQRNGVNAQTFRVYNTYTDASNYKRSWIGDDPYSASSIGVGSMGAGTGGTPDFIIRGHSNSAMVFRGATANIETFGNFKFGTDNTYDIGASGATRPRNIYAGTSVVGPDSSKMDASGFQVAAVSLVYWSGRSFIGSPSDGVFKLGNATNTDFDRLQFGGTSVSFPAIKRSGANLQFVLANDSAITGINHGVVSVSKNSSYSVVNKDSGAYFDNTGVTGNANFLLPTAAKGLIYTFIVSDSDGLTVVANVGETIRVGSLVSSSGGTAQASTVGNVITIVAISSTEWYATSVIGTWVLA